ncbi:hypothetical protein PR202_gb06215 [Eleusine coracana subsp. coracana]|uniref:Uncharacterized protein n=1 Tax=Eleusine coracana subsp. coracana TaxID=191504 RepID=A0AAV5E6I6_ELECO|nr:hypothetical protein PR202_gb06215 [Eleusine coracana subsp. coracana]
MHDACSTGSSRRSKPSARKRGRHGACKPSSNGNAGAIQAARDAGHVPGFLFFPSNLLLLSLMLHLPRLHASLLPAGVDEFRDLPDPVVKLPGCVPVHGADLLQILQDRTSDAYRWMLHHGEKYRDAKGILVNTFHAVEPGAVDALCAAPDIPPVYPIGPVTRQMDTADDEDDATGCVAWLDAQPDGSVLFVSLGSGGAIPVAQTRELARGLEASGHRFLWVVRRPPTPSVDDQVNNSNPGESYYDGGGSRNDDPLRILPPGFIDRNKE